MSVTFRDEQDKTNPRNGSIIENPAELDEVFAGSSHRPPFFFSLTSQDSSALLVGVGKGIGCVQHSVHEVDGPYLVAVGGNRGEQPGADVYEEFLMAGTPTPIPTRYCLPLDHVIRIVGVFVRHGCRAADVPWEEI